MAEQIKVSWKLGGVEMQYEGNEEFLKSGFPKLFQELLEIYKSGSKNGELHSIEPPASLEKSTENTLRNKKLVLSLNAITKKLGSKEPKDFVLASCTYLALVEQKDTFTRDEIRDAMKTTLQYKDENHRKSLSHNIEALMKDGFLTELAPKIYEVNEDQLKQLRVTLAGD